MLVAMIQSMQNQIRALQTQQNSSVVDASLKVRIQTGLLPDGSYGMRFLDPSGNERVRIGQLADADYGLAIYSNANDGSYVEINDPVTSGAPSGTLTTTSTSFTTIAGSPTVSITVGASGKAFVSLNGTVGISGTGSFVAQAVGALYVDGVANGPQLFSSVTLATTGGTQITGGNSALLTGLSQGSHALTVEYKSVFGQSVSFSAVEIVAIPY